MDVHLNKAKRFERIREQMTAAGVDVLIGTRMGTVNYLAGGFLPWRSVVLVSRDGHESLITFLIDEERLRHECWLDDVTGYSPFPGRDLWGLVAQRICESGWDRASLGIEIGDSPRPNVGFLSSTEYDQLKAALPDARFVPALSVVDRTSFIKDDGEIRLMRQAAAIADSAITRVKNELAVGMTETNVAGVGEMELRRLGSEYHWAVTGSSEVASGDRTAWTLAGTTPPTEKLIQAGDNVLVDFHPSYRHYLSDLGHNFIMGSPTPEQRKLAEAFVGAAHRLVDAIQVGNTVGSICHAVTKELEASGYLRYAIPLFGHGLGFLGNDWYVPIADNDETRDVVIEDNVVEVAFLCITVPGVGGMRVECPVLATPTGGEMLNGTPLEPTIIEV